MKDWESKVGRSWFSAGTVPGVFIPSIDDARQWSKTTRGGWQYDLLAEVTEDLKDVPACMNTWGHCE